MGRGKKKQPTIKTRARLKKEAVKQAKTSKKGGKKK